MKVLELRFKNINSLYGEWIVDFTNPEYISNGIFTLTGPTGAGKSTILDAICLALYGATPRLGKITKSGNEIMSRQTGECYAEVLFESQAGHFRCHWEQRRARKRADGNLQDQEHQIVDADTGKPIETKKSLVLGVIEEKTGMDFDRFTRSILLAQGGFDTFLKANLEQKSKVLEQITGTEIYSEISRRVHEYQRKEKEKLDLLRAEISGIVILEPEQEKEIQEELEARQKEETELSSKCTETEKAITWLNTIDGLRKEIDSFSEEELQLQSDIEAFKPESDKLDKAIKAGELDGLYATLTAIRKQQSEDRANLKVEEENLPELESSAKEQAESLKSAEQQTIKSKEKLKEDSLLIQKVRLLDQKLAEQKKTISKEEKCYKKDAAKIDTDKNDRLKEQEKCTKALKNLKLASDYLKKHESDEWLIRNLTGIEEQFGNLLSKQKEITQKETDHKRSDTALKQVIKKLNECTKQCNICKQKLEGVLKNLQQKKEALSKLLAGRLLREYRTEKESLLREKAFLSKIAKLKDHRSELEDGKPCPLCGAKEHPFAEGNIPVLDETEKKIKTLTKLISKAEDQEAAIKEIEETKTIAEKNLTAKEKLKTIAENDKKVAERNFAELKNSLGQLQTDFTKQKQTISAKLQPLGITDISDEDVSSLLESLRKRLSKWQAYCEKKDDIETQIVDFNSEIKRLDAVIKTQSNTLVEKKDHLETLKKEYTIGNDERKQLYGDKKPDDEEQHLKKSVTNAEEEEKKARTQCNKLQQKLNITKDRIESLKKQIDKREPELKRKEDDFTIPLGKAGFPDEKQFLEARLTAKQRNALFTRKEELNDKQTVLKTKQKDRETRLATERTKEITNKPLQELELQSKKYKDTLKQLSDTIANLRYKLNENTTAKKRIKGKRQAIEAQKKEYYRWEKLHSLIGSADGKKYRNFAQGLTFELMVSHANRQLKKMTDRYLLIRDDEQPLELNVIDDYQAGEIRSTKNLSGGESFIVSLTLALGLSKMASRKVRVDSLFLDEGFGTLDEEALETALETLSGLQQNGKLIGIISHVSALKERIGTQITITPVSGGRSSLKGPGCRKVVNNE